MRKSTILMAGAAAMIAFVAPAAHAGRGTDGELKLIYWQAVSTLNPYLSGGTKDVHGASMVIEPLARYDETGTMVPMLVESIPTVENGGISADLKTVTWKLKSDIKWSDGTPLTSEDVVFTWQYCLAPGGGCAQSAYFEGVTNVEAIDGQTVKITFVDAKPFPYGPFVGAQSPIIQKAQFKDCLGPKAPECTSANFGPIGTGPFKVKELKPNDVVLYEANPNYRDPNKPAFATATIKGGGDAASAARSVLETGEYDYAWNIMIEPEIRDQMAAAGKGVVVSSYGTQVERIELNHYAVDPKLGDKRSTKEAGPHPFISDPAVRKALSIAIDRSVIVDSLYGDSGVPTCNILPAPDVYKSSGADWCLTQDIDGANKLLEDAGWKKGGDGIRARDGVRLSILYQTSTNSVRQATQALVKDWWSQIGIETELRNISASVFFGGDPASPDTFQKFYADVEMYTNNFDGTDPEKYMAGWTCNKIPSPQNGWQGENMPRFCNESYNKLIEELGKTSGIEKRAEIAIKLNDILSNEGALIPLVHRGDVSAHSATLEGVRMNSWDSQLWNVADWTRKK